MATQGFDFSNLTLRGALDLAILIEEEAQERYLEFADQLEIHHTFEAACFFRRMSETEARRRAALRRRRRRLFQDAPRAIPNAMRTDVKAPDYDEVRAFMTAREAVNTVLHAEERAEAFFLHALPRTRDPEVRALFDKLLHEEVREQERLNDELAALPADSGRDPQDFADEPVAH